MYFSGGLKVNSFVGLNENQDSPITDDIFQREKFPCYFPLDCGHVCRSLWIGSMFGNILSCRNVTTTELMKCLSPSTESL